LLRTNDFPKGINVIIFLLHKLIGLGTIENVLHFDDPKVQEFFSIINQNQFSFKIGFDSCSVPALINITRHININSLDTYESGH